MGARVRRMTTCVVVLVLAAVVAYAARDAVLRYRAGHWPGVQQFDVVEPYTGFGHGHPLGQDSGAGEGITGARISRDDRIQLVLMIWCAAYTGTDVEMSDASITVTPYSRSVPHGTCSAMAMPIFVDVPGVSASDLTGRTLIDGVTGGTVSVMDCRGIEAGLRGSRICYYPDGGGDPSLAPRP
jgi:hypothetical protein